MHGRYAFIYPVTIMAQGVNTRPRRPLSSRRPGDPPGEEVAVLTTADLPVSCQGAAGSVMRLAAPVPPPTGPGCMAS
jgi:hypothetical protein